jgi:hypothetical protein
MEPDAAAKNTGACHANVGWRQNFNAEIGVDMYGSRHTAGRVLK